MRRLLILWAIGSVVIIVFVIGIIFCLWSLTSVISNFLAGVVAAIIVLLIEAYYDKSKLKNNFKWLEGKWNGSFNLEGRKIVEVEENEKSEAKLTYENDNLIKVVLSHDFENGIPKRSWEGKLEMNKQITSRGSIVAKYNDNHETRYMEVLVSSDNDNDYIFLFPVIFDNRNSEYGIQVFQRLRNK